ncbi:hypothetical protein QOT17_018389 [Balamuthia mandrillaris]
MAHAPYYALFFTPKQVGSMHDYTIHKLHYAQYLEYLEKEPDEAAALATDHAVSSWAVLLDKGYVGPASDTPGLRRIALQRGRRLAPAAHAEREALKRLRVPIERWFGRQQCSGTSSVGPIAGTTPISMMTSRFAPFLPTST